MCCALGALIIAAIAAWRRLLSVTSGWHRGVCWVAAVAAALALGVGAAAAAQHFGHYAARAEINERTVLAEMLAQPICDGIAPSSRANGQLLSQLD
ncbi:hypothetical protein HNQ96_004882 [Aminobacter lissarensis]|uniref:Uncharacterized protein n=1 Tax=Aminobacter carboxidus TaxID=376165 RepID=A0A8E1WKF6_9HYPH|nr:hypothetical protein [Aminobacter lissarensis]MBB6468995.1 hypothetical protein [Aminobacter lissarensis]